MEPTLSDVNKLCYELRDLLKEASECGFDICDATDRQLLAEWLIDRGVEVNL